MNVDEVIHITKGVYVLSATGSHTMNSPLYQNIIFLAKGKGKLITGGICPLF